MKDIKVPNSDAAQAELFATNFKLPPTNTSVIGYYETSSQEYSHAVVYRAHLVSLRKSDKLWIGVYHSAHGLFKQSDRFRVGSPRTAVAKRVASKKGHSPD